MTIATGVNKKVIWKRESVFGTAPTASGATYLRRVTSSLDLTKAAYDSKQIRPDYQISDLRHGVRSVTGDIKDELSPGTWADFIAAALRKDFVTGATTGAIATVTAATGTPGTFTRSGGSYLTDGFKVGDIVRWTGWTTTGVANNSKNFRIVALTALVMSCNDLSGAVGTNTVAAKTAGDSVTCTVYGKKTYVPATGHTNVSYTIEQTHSDITVFDKFMGLRVASLDLNMPSTGMSEISVAFMGQDMSTSGSAYYTTPSAATTTGILAAVNGKLSYNGTEVGIITNLALKIDGGMTSGSVVGSNLTPDVFPGRVKVTGSLTAYFQDSSITTDFISENTPSLMVALSTDNTATADFINIVIPKLKLTSATRSDGEQGITVQCNFQALLNGAGGTGISSELTTISVQDSAAA